MLSSLDNVINAGIRFEANVREIDRTESALRSLDRNLRSTAAAAGILSEGTNTANRSLNKQAGSAGGASTGLAGLQSQLAATAAAQKALKSSSGDLDDALSNLSTSAQDLSIDAIAGDILDNLDDLDGAPDDFSLDAHIDGEDDAKEFARILTGLQEESFGADKLFGGDKKRLDEITGMQKELEAIRDMDGGEELFDDIFARFHGGDMLEDFPLDPRSDEFPDDLGNRLDSHIFDQLNRNTDFDTFGELMDSDETPADFLTAGGFAENRDHRGLKNIDGEGTNLIDQEDILSNLDDEGILNTEQFFRASDDELSNALEGTMFGESGITPDELREGAIRNLASGEIEGKKLGDVTPMGEGEDPHNAEYANLAIGMEDLKDSNSSKQTPSWPLTRASKMDDSPLKERAENLSMLITQNEEINSAISNSTNLEEAIEMVGELDTNGFVGINRALDNPSRRDRMAKSLVDRDSLSSRVGEAKTRPEFAGMIDSNLALGNDRQAEILQNMMSDLDPSQVKGKDGSSLPITRETLGLMTMQEMMDTDPDTEPDRHSDLQGIMRSVFHPSDGVKKSLLREQSVMEEGFYTDLQDALPSNLTSPGGIGQNTDQPDIARDITDEFLTGTQTEGKGISNFIGEESENIGDVVSRATNRFDFDDPNALDKASRETENLLPMMMQDQFGSQVAPGLMEGQRGSDVNMNDMLPGMDVLSDNREQGPNFSGWFDGLDDQMSELRSAQKNAPVLRGGALAGLLGGEGNKKGVFGALSESAGGMSFFDSPRKMNRFNNFLEEGANAYEGMIPLLEATSLRLGSVNVDFESLGTMFFKLTSMLGPLVAALGGLAAAAGTAGAAMGGVLLAGAVDFLGEMEDTMAGVSDRQEAMGELASTLKDMALEAIMPLRQARIGGDGDTGAQFFVEVLRNGLSILNRISNILAYVVELDVVGSELARLSNFLNDPSGDSELARQLGELTKEVLPLLNDMIIALFGSFGGFSEFASSITQTLGTRLLRVLQQIAPVLALLTSYGAGFFDMALLAVGVLAQLISVLETVAGGFARLLSLIPGLTLSTNDFAFAVGGLIGFMNIASRAATFMAAQKLLLSKALYGAATAASWFTAANYGLASSLALVSALLGTLLVQLLAVREIWEIFSDTDWGLNLESLVAAGTIGGLATLILLLGGLQAILMGGIKLGKLGGAIAGIASKLGVGAMAIAKWSGNLAVIISLTKWLAKVLAGKVLVGITTISAVTVGWVAVIIAALALFADLIYWLATGESFLISWGEHLQRILSYLDRASEIWDNITDNGQFNVEMSESELDERFGSDRGNSESENITDEDDATVKFGGPGGGADADVDINVDASRSNREVARMIQNEIKSWWRSVSGDRG